MTNNDFSNIYDIIKSQEVVIHIYIMNAFRLVEQINIYREKMKTDGNFCISFCEDQCSDYDIDAKQLILDIVYKSEINRPDAWRTVRHTLTVFKRVMSGHKEEIGTILYYTNQ